MALVFPLSQIAVTAGIMAVVSLLLLFGTRRYFQVRSTAEIIIMAVVAGFSVLAWRSAGNTTALNADPLPAISPNDVLCPLVTYVFLGLYASIHAPSDEGRWAQARALLTLLSFVVNVVTI
jgi:amino acid transporter